MKNLKLGDMLLVNNNSKKGIRGLFAKAIKYFTKSQWTHVAVYASEIFGIDSLFEAEFAAIMNPSRKTFDDPLYTCRAFRYKHITEEEMKQVMNRLYNRLAGSIYAYLQNIYWIRVWFWRRTFLGKMLYWIPVKIFKKNEDIRKWNNWFVNGTICSELLWWQVKFIAEQVGDNALLLHIEEWNSNNYSPADFFETVNTFTYKFEEIAIKN